ncbi:hypothetical protein LXA43DRAFT_626713 [Ganoderma leucocontextum]|nr:hypothetical protein LXA43DRAFT_626713 [Ganoderma leucocontextum]
MLDKTTWGVDRRNISFCRALPRADRQKRAAAWARLVILGHIASPLLVALQGVILDRRATASTVFWPLGMAAVTVGGKRWTRRVSMGTTSAWGMRPRRTNTFLRQYVNSDQLGEARPPSGKPCHQPWPCNHCGSLAAYRARLPPCVLFILNACLSFSPSSPPSSPPSQ